MAIDTAGYTAMLCVMALQAHWQAQGVTPGSGDVLVTGAGGGVGSVAIALLARAGHWVAASTGRPHEADYLHALGAADVIHRAQLSTSGRPLQKERWIGVVDAVGSHTLANACASTCYGGGGGVRAYAGLGLSGDGGALHSARRHARRHRQRDGADGAARRGMVAAGGGVGWGGAGAHDADHWTRRRHGCAHDVLAGRVQGRLRVDVNA